ncbi:MAG: hypothetical protein P8X74_04805 [Reinekea sp.]
MYREQSRIQATIFEKQIEIKLLHPASTEEVADSGLIDCIAWFFCHIAECSFS